MGEIRCQGRDSPGGYKQLQDWEQPVVTGWHRDVLGEEEENVCLSIHLPGECYLRCCLGPASASGF